MFSGGVLEDRASGLEPRLTPVQDLATQLLAPILCGTFISMMLFGMMLLREFVPFLVRSILERILSLDPTESFSYYRNCSK